MPIVPALARTARALARQPGFALGAILTLAVAIGVSAAVFSVVNAALLRPLPFAQSDRPSFLTREGDSAVLFGVTPADLPAYGLAVVALVAGAASACVVPALRAARLDPAAILREA
jgi:ABC-type antimicrobial peptide transport system permease subunit